MRRAKRLSPSQAEPGIKNDDTRNDDTIILDALRDLQYYNNNSRLHETREPVMKPLAVSILMLGALMFFTLSLHAAEAALATPAATPATQARG